MKAVLIIVLVCMIAFIWYPKPMVDYNCGIKVPELKK
jgi:hypothetical protein